jgi:hypothetical protein
VEPIDTSPEELRNAASYIEETSVDALGNFSDIAFPLVTGGLKDFPRESAESQAAEQGLIVLETSAEEAVVTLHALAAILENRYEIPPHMWESARPYLEAYRERPQEQGQAG